MNQKLKFLKYVKKKLFHDFLFYYRPKKKKRSRPDFAMKIRMWLHTRFDPTMQRILHRGRPQEKQQHSEPTVANLYHVKTGTRKNLHFELVTSFHCSLGENRLFFFPFAFRWHDLTNFIKCPFSNFWKPHFFWMYLHFWWQSRSG